MARRRVRNARLVRCSRACYPGLRDVRTPLTVGYLWLITAWLIWGHLIPREKPADEGPVARLFELSEFLGATSVLAAISFIAYILGALLTIPAESRPVVTLAYSTALASPEARAARDQLVHLLRRVYPGGPSHSKFLRVDLGDLRPRLMVASTELYGEYDRLAAEASFRLNVGLPILALGVVAGIAVTPWLTLVSVVVAVWLLAQGFIRLRMAVVVIERALVAGVIEHPAFQEPRFGRRAAAPDADVAGP